MGSSLRVLVSCQVLLPHLDGAQGQCRNDAAGDTQDLGVCDTSRAQLDERGLREQRRPGGQSRATPPSTLLDSGSDAVLLNYSREI